jgi:hypothetical protein
MGSTTPSSSSASSDESSSEFSAETDCSSDSSPEPTGGLPTTGGVLTTAGVFTSAGLLTAGSAGLVVVCAGCPRTAGWRGGVGLEAGTELVVRGTIVAGCFFGGGGTTLGLGAAAFVTTGFAEDVGLAVGCEARGVARTLLVVVVWRPDEAATRGRGVAGFGFGEELGLFTAAGLVGAETLPVRDAGGCTPVD